MLCCESHFKENAELLVTVALGKICMSDIVFILLLTLPFVKIFTLHVLLSWFTLCIFTAFWWNSHLLHNMWNTYTFKYKYMYAYICRYVFTQKKSEKKRMRVNQSKDNQFFWLIQWKLETYLYWGLKKYLLSVINVSAGCFLWINV